TDGGNTWQEIIQGLEPRCNVETILLDPLSSRTLWLVSTTGPPEKRLWKSTDAGASWAPVEHTLGKAQFSLLAAEPRDGRTILYGQVHPNRRLHRSDDGGVSWLEIDPGPPGSSWVESLLPLPNGDLLAATRRGVLRSRDRGASWTPSNRGLSGNAISGLALDPGRPWIYASVEGVGLFKSENGGASWKAAPVSSSPGSGPWGSVAIHPQKPDTVYLGSFRHLARSEDGGKSWTVYDVPCDDPQMVVTDPALPTGLYGASELGTCSSSCAVSKSVDDGKTWTCVFLVKRERVKLLTADPVRPLTVYVQKDGDLYRSENAGFSWDLLAKALQAFTLAFAPTPSGAIYAGKRYGVVRSLDGGKSWLRSGPGLPADDPVVGIVFDPKSPSTLYAATRYQGIFRSTDAGVTWKLHAPAPPDVSVERLVIDPRGRALYVGTGSGGVMRWKPTPPPPQPP
ncbi:MAG TPA: hypothetical protein VJ725_11850, partial [Thermoanaerobaculia bacterium]|nr:hypothetical protein [Thermoanaerobaculia bacterium]